MRSHGIEIQPIMTGHRDAPTSTRSSSPTSSCPTRCCSATHRRLAPGDRHHGRGAAAISGYVNIDRAVALRGIAAAPGPNRDDAVRALGELDAYANAIKALGVRETIRLLDGQGIGAGVEHRQGRDERAAAPHLPGHPGN